MPRAVTVPSDPRCDFCGGQNQYQKDIGDRSACFDCAERIKPDLCPACDGSGLNCLACGSVCLLCQGEGLRRGAACPYAGHQFCESDTCAECKERIAFLVDERMELSREVRAEMEQEGGAL